MAKSMFDEASVKFTFPGKVVEANGATVDGNTATFDMLALNGTVVQAKAEANAGIPMWIIWILVAVLVIAGALVLLFVLLRKRSARQEPALAGATPYGQPGYAPQPGGQAGYAPQQQSAYNPQQPYAPQQPPYSPQPPVQQPPVQQPGQTRDDGL